MSELVPEVGDVWAEKLKNNAGFLLHNVICVNAVYVAIAHEIVEKWGNVELKTITHSFITKKALMRMKYIGKSKANINQLFEVQDDSNI